MYYESACPPAALEKTLTNRPRTLYETYDRILADISEEHGQGVLCLLQWLTFSVRPISLDEGCGNGSLPILAQDSFLTLDDGFMILEIS